MFQDLFKELVNVLNAIKKEAEKHRFSISRLQFNPYFLIELRCSRAATDETIFYLEISKKGEEVDFRIKDKNGNYM